MILTTTLVAVTLLAIIIAVRLTKAIDRYEQEIKSLEYVNNRLSYGETDKYIILRIFLNNELSAYKVVARRIIRYISSPSGDMMPLHRSVDIVTYRYVNGDSASETYALNRAEELLDKLNEQD